MKKFLKRTTITISILFLFVGCHIVEDKTGHHIRLSPTVHKQIGEAAEGATGILEMLSFFFPALVPVAAAGATGTYVWKRMGKNITKYQTPLEHTVNVIETIKQYNPKLWTQMKPYIKGEVTGPNLMHKPSAKTEVTIRELIDKYQDAV